MQRLNKENSLKPTQEAKGYLSFLANVDQDNNQEQDKVFDRMIDAYMFAAAYAIYQQIEPEQIYSKGRQELARGLSLLDDQVLLSLEVGIAATYQRQGKPQPTDSKELLEILTQYAEAGLKVLKERWKGKLPRQIQSDISHIIQTSLS